MCATVCSCVFQTQGGFQAEPDLHQCRQTPHYSPKTMMKITIRSELYCHLASSYTSANQTSSKGLQSSYHQTSLQLELTHMSCTISLVCQTLVQPCRPYSASILLAASREIQATRAGLSTGVVGFFVVGGASICAIDAL